MRAIRNAAIVVVALLSIVGSASSLHGQQTKPASLEYNDQLFQKDLQAFFRATWVESYRKLGHHAQAWEEPAFNFLEKFCENASYQPVWRGIVPNNITHNSELLSLGKDVMTHRCDDPQVLAAYGVAVQLNGSPRTAAAELRGALRGMNDAEHPAYNIVYVCNLLLQDEWTLTWQPGERSAVIKAAVDSTVRLMTDVPPTRAERYIRYREIRLLTASREDIREQIARQLETAKNIDPWLLNVFMGDCETQRAWKIRGIGLANTVTQEAWRGFGEHMQKARDHLITAIKIDPAVPGPAQLMIPVAMGTGTDGDESPRAWFIRARSAKMDDQWAMEAFVWSLRPRWGGSYAELLSLGKEFVASNRFDTKVPIWLIDAVYTISSDQYETDYATYRRPEVYEALKEMFEGYTRSLPDGYGRDYVLSEQAAVASAAERYADARTVLDRLGSKLDRSTFSIFGKDPTLTVSQVYAFTGPNGTEAQLAMREMQAHDPNALKHFANLAAGCKESDPEWFFYNAFLPKVKFESEYSSGNWADIQPKDALRLWQPVKGEWKVDGNKLVGTCSGRGLELRFKPTTGSNFEIEATLSYEAIDNRVNACGIFCDHNNQTWANGIFYSVGYRDMSWYANGKTGAVAHPPKKENLLHITMQNGKISATINGDAVPVPEMTEPARELGPDARICIAALYPETPLTLTVTGLKVRSLDAVKK